MRLSQKECQSIKHSVYEIFGEGTKILLFGSRVDDTKRGGDIDLYIKPLKPESAAELLRKKLDLLYLLEERIGEQQIDIIVAKDDGRAIEKEALKKGARL